MQLGGLICHLLLVPIFVLACVPPITATVLLALTERYDVELAQAALCILCCYKSSPGDALGVASTAAAAAITAALAIGGVLLEAHANKSVGDDGGGQTYVSVGMLVRYQKKP